jgi:two-component system, cell cycle sensor histidine kinase and response regulator CckA
MNNIISQLPSQTATSRSASVQPSAEALLAGVLRASPLGIGCLSDRTLTAANSKLGELTGHSLEKLVGLPFGQLFNRTSEVDRVWARLQEAHAADAVIRVETQWLRADGRVIEVLLTLTPMAEYQHRWTFTALDVTPQREAQEEIVLCQEQLAGFHAISAIMQRDEPDTEMFNAIAREVSEMTGFPVVAIELCDFNRSVMIYCGAHGLQLDGLPEPLEIPMDVTPSGQVALTGETLVETEAAVRRECAAPFFRQFAAETFICVPIRTNHQVVGALSLAHRRRENVPPRLLLQIQSLANYLATLFGRLRAREAVRKGEAELSAVYDRAPSLMCLLDEKLQIVRANRAALEFAPPVENNDSPLRVGAFLGCESVSQKSEAKCVAAKLCIFCELRRAAQETLKTGKGWHRVRVAKNLLQEDRAEDLTFLISTARLRVDGSTRVLLCLEDITQNEQANEKIRSQAALLDVARDAIIVRDFADKISYWNEGAHRMYGWTAAETIGKTVSELLLGEEAKVAAEAFRAVQDREDWSGEMQHLTRAGAKLTVQSRWTLVRDRSGAPKGILIVNTDRTERKRLESQLLRAQRLESIGTLASGLAHDLNNVLAPIMMSVHMLKEEATNDSSRACLDTLETCAQRGSDIVSQVLMFARGVEGSRLPVHPKHLMTDIQRIVRETFPRSIRVDNQISKQTSLVECDSTQMQQVLMNLCVNARDAMPQGGTLTLRSETAQLGADAATLHPKAHAGNYVVLSVTDTGTGIAPEVMEKMFDPFFTTKPLGHGTGLGLPIVMGIAENHGGFVQVESRVGQGTTFRVYLPAAITEQERIVGPRGGVELPQGTGQTVLIVDDEPAIRRIVDVILSKNGYRTVVASDGREAVALFCQHTDEIDFVVSDLMMPYQDGPTTIRAIRKMKDSVRVLAITGLGEEARIAEAKAAGAESFIKKPFTAHQLLAAVKSLASVRPV